MDPRQPTPSRSRPLQRRDVLTRSSRFGPNMTPMVDVTLVILIFFMASATIAGHEWFLRAQLPKPIDAAGPDSGFALPEAVLNADLFMRDGRVFVRGISDQPPPLEDFLDQIRAIETASAAKLVLTIRAADDVAYASIIALHDAASGRGIRVAIR